jgi:ubiquinone/menaquinone biosynthesis C-methylase UbiE
LIHLPQKIHIRPTEIADPLKFYYFPIIRRLFIKRLELAVSELRPRRYEALLDIGCGSGIFLKELAFHCHRLFALDMHGKMDRVKDMTQKEHIAVHLVEGSALHLPFAPDSFDGVVMVSVLEHLHQPLQALKEIGRITKEGGRIVLGFPIKNSIMDFLFKVSYHLLPSAKLEEEHVSSHADIIKVADSFFGPRAIKTFPSFLPLDYGAYCIYSVAKTTERWP